MSKGKRRVISWAQGLPCGSYIHKGPGPRAPGHLLIEYTSFPTLAGSLKHALWPPSLLALQGPQRVSALPDIPLGAFGMPGPGNLTLPALFHLLLNQPSLSSLLRPASNPSLNPGTGSSPLIQLRQGGSEQLRSLPRNPVRVCLSLHPATCPQGTRDPGRASSGPAPLLPSSRKPGEGWRWGEKSP